MQPRVPREGPGPGEGGLPGTARPGEGRLPGRAAAGTWRGPALRVPRPRRH